eukprot:349673-Chlamydomonas_euryale.AAC.3
MMRHMWRRGGGALGTRRTACTRDSSLHLPRLVPLPSVCGPPSHRRADPAAASKALHMGNPCLPCSSHGSGTCPRPAAAARSRRLGGSAARHGRTACAARSCLRIRRRGGRGAVDDLPRFGGYRVKRAFQAAGFIAHRCCRLHGAAPCATLPNVEVAGRHVARARRMGDVARLERLGCAGLAAAAAAAASSALHGPTGSSRTTSSSSSSRSMTTSSSSASSGSHGSRARASASATARAHACISLRERHCHAAVPHAAPVERDEAASAAQFKSRAWQSAGTPSLRHSLTPRSGIAAAAAVAAATAIRGLQTTTYLIVQSAHRM